MVMECLLSDRSSTSQYHQHMVSVKSRVQCNGVLFVMISKDGTMRCRLKQSEDDCSDYRHIVVY